ncbi:MAG: hypothetical protein ACI4TA_01830 [Acetatifactor sp.]
MTIATLGLFVFIIYQLSFVKESTDRIINFIVMLIFFELFANVGKMLVIAGTEIQYSDVLWGILFIYSAINMLSHPVNRKGFARIALFLAVLVILLLCEVATSYSDNTFSFRSILIFLRFLMMLCVYEGTIRYFDEIRIEKLIKSIFNLQKFMYIFLIIEVVFKLVNSSLYFNMISVLFGHSENQVNWLIIRGGLPALQGLCKEPSHFAICFLFVSVFDLWLIIKGYRVQKYFFINCALLLLSGSFSSILYLGALIAMYLILTKGINKIVIAFIVILIGVPVGFMLLQTSSLGMYYLGRLTNALSITRSGNLDTYTSEGQRLSSVLGSLTNFFEHPLIGNGIGNNVSTGAFPALLSSLGLVGTISYALAMIRKSNVLLPMCIIMVAAFFAMDMGLFYSSYFMIFIYLFEKIKIEGSLQKFEKYPKLLRGV